MEPIRELGRRLRVFFGFGRAEDELTEEMRLHLELLAEEKQEAGLDAEDAVHAARRQFGNAGVLKEESREAWGWSVLDRLSQDLRNALRALVRQPIQAFLILATLGLAMGANLAVFTLLDKMVLRPLPVAKPYDLVAISAPMPEPRKFMIGGGSPGQSRRLQLVFGMDYPFYRGFRDRVHLFQGVAASAPTVANLATSGDPVMVRGLLVTGNYFDVYGIKAHLGRTLTAADDQPSGGDAPR